MPSLQSQNPRRLLRLRFCSIRNDKSGPNPCVKLGISVYSDSLQNLSTGIDGGNYRWVDLDGEGISGVPSEQADDWYYKPNLGNGRFGPVECVMPRPSLAALSSGHQQLLDLTGDGNLDQVEFGGQTPGFFARTDDEESFDERCIHLTDTDVTPILFYDPVERVVATLHPNHTYEKIVFDPWQQETWDVNDTVNQSEPKDDADVGGYFIKYPEADYMPTRYDVFNRSIQVIAPHGSQSNTKIDVIRPGYNEANLLERLDAWLGQTAEPTTLLDSASTDLHAVTNIDYDAKGQRIRIAYGNGAATEYTYDDQTFRLIHLKTDRTGAAAQNLLQRLLGPECDYVYDAIYRLTNATGREHIGQLAKPETTWDNEFRINLPHPNDGQAMRNYSEQYLYDEVGNFEKLIQQAANGNWTRGYIYNEASLIEPANPSLTFVVPYDITC